MSEDRDNPAAPAAPLPIDAGTRALVRRFWRDWIAGRGREIVVSLLLMAGVAATAGAYPQVIRYSYDTLTAGNLGALGLVLSLIIGVTLFRAIVLYLQSVAANRLVLAISVDLQKAVFAQLVEADFARIARDSPGHVVSRLTNDVQFVQTALLTVLNSAVRDTLTILAVVAVMFHTDWLMTLVVLCVYPVAAWPIVAIGKRLRRNARRTQSGLGDMTAELSESISGVRLIKAFGLEKHVAGRLNRRFDDIFRLRMKAVRARSALDPMLEALGGFAVAGVIALITYRIAAGVLTVGDFMAFLTALFMAAQPIRGLGNLNARLQEGLAAVERIYAVLDEKPTIVDKPGARPLEVPAGAIEFRDVSFAYAADEPAAVRAFSLAVEGGRTVALVGRSGAGKSTIINLVPRLFDVTAGAILIDGQDVRDVTVASLRQAIALVSQDITLFNDTVSANIALGRLGASEAEIVAASEQAMADEFVRQLPDGYQTVLGDRGMRLSGGQRQRIALARAILKGAPILLLDEATSALDTQSERAVQEALARFARNRTTLVIAHRLSTVQNADLICVLEDGALVESGRHRDLVAANGPYARLVLAQLADDSDHPMAADGAGGPQ
ncbi:MAG: ATP-binding cassette domain-containing protein [Rhizobiales bacterium]|nr:ATP-binding cassette domain-containing protein [Hyphomicrobiales bacterium]